MFDAFIRIDRLDAEFFQILYGIAEHSGHGFVCVNDIPVHVGNDDSGGVAVEDRVPPGTVSEQLDLHFPLYDVDADDAEGENPEEQQEKLPDQIEKSRLLRGNGENESPAGRCQEGTGAFREDESVGIALLFKFSFHAEPAQSMFPLNQF